MIVTSREMKAVMVSRSRAKQSRIMRLATFNYKMANEIISFSETSKNCTLFWNPSFTSLSPGAVGGLQSLVLSSPEP
jgi:hypothetical protein